MTEHPLREELVRAVRRGDRTFDDHLRTCAACRELVEIWAAFPVSGRRPLTNAPAALVSRAKAIPAGVTPRKLREAFSWFFDSWRTPAPVGIRGEVGPRERRLMFRDEDIVFDLRAEYRDNRWSFVAQIAAPGKEEFRIHAGRRRISPDDSGFYHWDSKQPPERLELRATKMRIQLPELKWHKSPQKK